LIYYSVFDRDGKKIVDCNNIKDAMMLVEFDNTRTYRQMKHINPQTVNVPYIKLPDDLRFSEQKILSQCDLEPFIV
jgi:hypothetical protein